jgi:hypothetical protein
VKTKYIRNKNLKKIFIVIFKSIMTERYKTEIKISIGNDEEMQKKQIFISYSSETRDMCYKAKKHFESLGFEVWINIGIPKEFPIDAIESSWCVLIFILKKDEHILYSKAERDYAYNLNKPYVPLMIEKFYNSDGW